MLTALRGADWTASSFGHRPKSAMLCGVELDQLHLLGNGSYAKVYKATNRDGVHVAIKLYVTDPPPSPFEPDVANEASVWSRLEHPHIARLLGVQLQPQNVDSTVRRWLADQNLTGAYLVSEFSAGDELFAALPLTAQRAVPLFHQVAQAVTYMHANGVYHGDIKPENIVLSEDRRSCKLIDFGFAGDVNKTALLRGTVFYSDPAMFREGTTQVDMLANDIFAIGASLFASVTSEPLYTLYNKRPVYSATVIDDRRCQNAVGWFTMEKPAQRPTAAQAEQMLSSCWQS